MQHHKIGPALLGAVLSYQKHGLSRLTHRARSMSITGLDKTQKEPRIVVFLRCSPTANFGEIARSHRVVVNEGHGTVRTAYLPIDSVDALSEHPDVVRISASRQARPCLDVALPRIHVPQLRSVGQLDGRGVIVGIVDTGIDPNHPDFTGRILRIWDQTLDGPGVVEGSFGMELTGANITGSRDTEGHGSHVAGIAAGADPTFTGVAPGADILFVKTDFSNVHIANGIQYIFRVARELGRPAVVNLSLGSHFDAHDGTDDLSELIDQLSGPGRIVCCAAGNEGEDNIHARAHIAANAVTQIQFKVPDQSPDAVLNGWYSPNDHFEIAVQAPNGQTTPFQAIITTGNFLQTHGIGGSSIDTSTPDIDPASGDHHFEVHISGAGNSASPDAGTWKLLVRGATVTNGVLDVWASDINAASTIPFLNNIDGTMKVGSPGSSLSAITVASYTTKVAFTDIAGENLQFGFTLEDISPFSSPGPLRKGQQKPNIAAPGATIVSALSADSSPNPQFIVNQHFRVDQGTSMASPCIAGVVALLLQANPQLTPAEVLQNLTQAGRIPNQPPNTFQNQWGFGLLDAAKLQTGIPPLVATAG
jgi:subtilisin family serine protease